MGGDRGVKRGAKRESEKRQEGRGLEISELGGVEGEVAEGLGEGVGAGFDFVGAEGAERAAELEVVEKLVGKVDVLEVAGEEVEALVGVEGAGEEFERVTIEEDLGWFVAIFRAQAGLGLGRMVLDDDLDAELRGKLAEVGPQAAEEVALGNALPEGLRVNLHAAGSRAGTSPTRWVR